ncbi:hypothetical protein V1503_19205 [Bacillus sp. SCS-151]
MALTDISGWYRRNSKNMKENDLRKALKEARQAEKIIMNELKKRGVA